MGKAKFIDKVKKLLGIKTEEEKKELAVTELVDKLIERKKILKEELNICIDVVKREIIKDSIRIVNKQIKKGKPYSKKIKSKAKRV